MSNERVVVKFAKSWRGYSAGECAGFDSVQAEALEAGGVAVRVKGGKAASASNKPSGGKPSTGGAKAGGKKTADAAPASADSENNGAGEDGADVNGGVDGSGAPPSDDDDNEKKP